MKADPRLVEVDAKQWLTSIPGCQLQEVEELPSSHRLSPARASQSHKASIAYLENLIKNGHDIKPGNGHHF